MDILLPAACALLAASLWGFSNHIQRLALDDTDALTGAFISVATMAIIAWMFAPFYVEWSWFATRGALIFAMMGLFFPALGQRFQIAGVMLVGPSLTASLSALTPLVAVAIGVVLIGEVLNLQAGFGLILMVIGLVLATYSPRGIKRGFPLWALLVPIGAAVVRGIAQPGMKLGMQDLPSPAFGLLIAASVSTVVLGLMAMQNKAKGNVRLGIGVRWFIFNGALNAGGIFLLNLALQKGTVTLVSPLAATSPLWALLFGALVFKREQLGLKHLGVAVLIVLGGALILLR